MRKILFDLTRTQPMDGTKYHGGGKYGFEVFYKLAEINPQKLVGFYNENLFIEEKVLEVCKKNKILLIKASEKTVIQAAREIGGVIYSPLFDPIYNSDPEIEVILTIHDMRPLEMVGDSFEKFYKHKRKLVGTLLLKFGLNNLRQRLIHTKKYNSVLRAQRDIFARKNLVKALCWTADGLYLAGEAEAAAENLREASNLVDDAERAAELFSKHLFLRNYSLPPEKSF